MQRGRSRRASRERDRCSCETSVLRPAYLPGQLPPPDPPRDAARRPSVWRSVVGCLLVIALSAATTVVFIKDEIGTLAGYLSFNEAINVPTRPLTPSMARRARFTAAASNAKSAATFGACVGQQPRAWCA